MLIFLFSGIVCHAQNCTLTPAQENQTFQFTNFSPTAWPIGQSTTVTLTGSWTTPPTPLGCNTDFISLQGLAAGGGNGVRDPNVTFSNIVESLSPLQTTFTATVSPAASHVEELYSVECVSSQGPSCPNYSEISGDIYLCPYSVPSISSVSPSTWVAGQTYNVTISGSNFVPGNIFSGSTANPGIGIGGHGHHLRVDLGERAFRHHRKRAGYGADCSRPLFRANHCINLSQRLGCRQNLRHRRHHGNWVHHYRCCNCVLPGDNGHAPVLSVQQAAEAPCVSAK